MPKTREVHWQHGWHPTFENYDLDLVVGEDGRASESSSHGYLVARRDQKGILASFGFEHVAAFGMPFAYALKNNEVKSLREARNLLVMPAGHVSSASSSDFLIDDSEYISFVGSVSSSFTDVKVCLHAADIRQGRARAWQEAGFTVLRGAEWTDRSSLDRMAKYFTQFEFVTTNGLGSHIPFASAAGSKLSICGPISKPPPQSIACEEFFFINRFDLIEIWTDSYEKQVVRILENAGFFCEPIDATEQKDWGRQQIGYDSIASPEETWATLLEIAGAPNWKPISLVETIPFIARANSQVSKQVRLGLGRLEASKANIESRKPLSLHLQLLNLAKLFISPARRVRIHLSKDLGMYVNSRNLSELKTTSELFVRRRFESVKSEGVHTIVDIGAATGIFSLYFALVFPGANVFAIEPDAGKADVLEANVAAFPAVTVVRRGVRAWEGRGSLIGDCSPLSSAKIWKGILQGHRIVEVSTLQSILDETCAEKTIDILRMNIGGAEYEVLLANLERLAVNCRLLIVRYHHALAKRDEISAIDASFSNLGLKEKSKVAGFTIYRF